MVLAAIAALIACVGVAQLEGTFHMPEELMKYSAPMPLEIELQRFAEQIIADRKNMAMIGGLIGLIACSALTMATLVGSSVSLARGVLVGAVLGAIFGAVGGFLSTEAHRYLLANSIDGFVDQVLYQGCLTVAVACGLALTLWLTASNVVQKQSIPVLVVVACISSVLYPFVSAIVFPVLKSQQTIPEGPQNQVLWLGLPLLLWAITIGRSRQPVSAVSESESESEAEFA